MRDACRALPLLALLACAPAPGAQGVPVAASAPSVQSSASPAPSAAPAAPPAPPSPFSVFAEGWGVTVADTHGLVVVHDSHLGAMVTVDGERIARVETPFDGLPSGPGVTGSITGGWPEGALIMIRAAKGGASNDWRVMDFFRRRQGAWVVQPGVGHRYKVQGEGWPLENSDGLGLQALAVAGAERRSVVFAWPESWKTPLLSLGGDGKPRVIGFVMNHLADQIAAHPSGVVAALVRGDTEKPGFSDRWFVRRWHPGKVSPVVTLVPDVPTLGKTDDLGAVMCLASNDAAYVVLHGGATGKSAFLTLGASTSEVQEIPGTREGGLVSACAVDRDRSVWFMLGSGTELIRRSPAGVFENVSYPSLPPQKRRPRFEADAQKSGRARVVYEDVPADEQDLGVFQGDHLFVADDGSVWITGFRTPGQRIAGEEQQGLSVLGFSRQVVLRLGPPLPRTPVDWDSFTPGIIETHLAIYNAQQSLSFWSGLFYDPARCSEPFVRLANMPKVASADDFSAVRAAVQGRAELAGTRFVEARVQGVRVLGALAPSRTAAQELLSLLKGRIPSAGARLYCGRPHVLRVIPMGIVDE